jgi:hypothetical protein
MRQHTSAYVSIHQHTLAYVSIRQHTSAYVSIRQRMRAVQRLRVYLLKGSLRHRFTTTALLLPLYCYRFTTTA